MRAPPTILIPLRVASIIALIFTATACKPKPAPAPPPKPSVTAAKTNAPAAVTNAPEEFTSVFEEDLMPPKGRDPFFPNSHRRDPVPVVAPTVKHTPSREVELKGIVGSPSHRLAVINNAILEVNEDGEVKVPGGHVKVHCLEIGEDFAVIRVEGETQPKRLELKRKDF